MGSTSKTTTLKGKNVEGTTVKLKVPNDSMKSTASNSINGFARPNFSPKEDYANGDPPYRRQSQNMNRISVENQLTAQVSDKYVSDTHDGSGDVPNLSNKEQWVEEMWKLFVTGNSLITLKSVNDDTKPATSEFKGFIKNFDWQEKAGSESSTYKVTIKHVETELLIG